MKPWALCPRIVVQGGAVVFASSYLQINGTNVSIELDRVDDGNNPA